LINDVLDLSKIEAGEVELSIEDVFLFEIIEEGFSLVAARAEERGIDLFVADGMVDMPTVQADRTRLLQVLVNLLSNAVKYNRADGKVIIGMEEVSGNMLRIAVSDTGEGIPEDKQAELFKPFSRLGAENSGIEGTGIGLVVCEDLIERMGGVIGMESEVGRGSTFWFELPMAEDDRERTVAEANDLVVPDKGVLPGTIGTLLYVEDNPANLVLMEKIVSRIKGLSMISAHTGELGIELARAKRPDIIILDINLPGLNGIEVLKKLRQYDDIRNTPILALSAAATKIDIEKGMEAGFLRYLTKPLVVSEIVDAIRSALGDSHSDNSRSRTNA
jgi:CheY-like chemotaxis protein